MQDSGTLDKILQDCHVRHCRRMLAEVSLVQESIHSGQTNEDNASFGGS